MAPFVARLPPILPSVARRALQDTATGSGSRIPSLYPGSIPKMGMPPQQQGAPPLALVPIVLTPGAEG